VVPVFGDEKVAHGPGNGRPESLESSFDVDRLTGFGRFFLGRWLAGPRWFVFSTASVLFEKAIKNTHRFYVCFSGLVSDRFNAVLYHRTYLP
jgi:hypothetical protein